MGERREVSKKKKKKPQSALKLEDKKNKKHWPGGLSVGMRLNTHIMEKGNGN